MGNQRKFTHHPLCVIHEFIGLSNTFKLICNLPQHFGPEERLNLDLYPSSKHYYMVWAAAPVWRKWSYLPLLHWHSLKEADTAPGNQAAIFFCLKRRLSHLIFKPFFWLLSPWLALTSKFYFHIIFRALETDGSITSLIVLSCINFPLFMELALMQIGFSVHREALRGQWHGKH